MPTSHMDLNMKQDGKDGAMSAIWAKIRSVRRRASVSRPTDKENNAPAQIVPGNSTKLSSSDEKRSASSSAARHHDRRTSKALAEKRPESERSSRSQAPRSSVERPMSNPAAGKVQPIPSKLSMRATDVDFKSKKVVFQAPSVLSFSRGIGHGAYGVVAAFKDARPSGKHFAIKFVRNAFHDLFDGQRILREIRLLRSLRHDNIVQLRGLYYMGSDCQDIYIVTDLMDTDLGKIIKSNETLTEEHHSWFTYQILRALHYLHSAGVVHRDLKPANVLVNKDCSVKLCDFGLARGMGSSGSEGGHKLTEYVVTRYYRAPEVILLSSDYGAKIDVWAAGCCLAELIGRKPLFKGKDPVDQITQIFKVLGTPHSSELAWLSQSSSAMGFVKRFGSQQGQSLNSLLPRASKNAIQAVKAMLTLDPNKRLCTASSMRLPFFANTYQVSDENQVAAGRLDWSFDVEKPTLRSLQVLLRSETQALSKELGLPVCEDASTVITFA